MSFTWNVPPLKNVLTGLICEEVVPSLKLQDDETGAGDELF